MGMYENNMQSMEKNKPFFYEQYINGDWTNVHFAAETQDAYDGGKVLFLDVHEKRYRMNSMYSPKKEAEIWAQQFEIKRRNIVTSFFGLGNGAFVRALLSKMRKEDMILIYEPCVESFLHVIHNYDLTDLLEDERISISVKGINDREFHEMLGLKVEWTNVKSQIFCVHPRFDQIFLEDYRDFLQIINDISMLAFLDRNTAAKMGKAMVHNILSNLAYLKGSNTMTDLRGMIPEDVPAIVVAAGPSLDKNIQYLKKAKGKSIIFATDRALDYLFAHGIEPDIIVTLDAIKPLKYFSTKENIQIPLFTKMESNHEILDFHKGKKIWYAIHPYIDDYFAYINRPQMNLNSGGSVATAAFSIALGLGLKKVILIGQDLAYAGVVTHAGGMSGESAVEMNVAGYVEDIYGNMVPTRHDWKAFLLWYENAIEMNPDIEVIDATEGGAKIKGSRILGLNETIEEYCTKPFDFHEVMQQVNSSVEEEHLKRLVTFLRESIRDLDIIAERAGKSAEYCEKLVTACKENTLGSKYNQRINQYIIDSNEQIQEKSIYKLIDTYIAEKSAEHLTNIYLFTGEKESDTVKTYKTAAIMYRTMCEAGIEIKNMLKKLLEEKSFA